MTKILIFGLFLLSIIINTKSDDTNSDIKQLHIIFRHGERAPTETYKNDPYANMTWSGGWGQLTNRGKFEMYSLGLKLKEIYKNFIPDYYFPDHVRVMSSYADRCLMSAQTLLAAIFPPKGEQIWNDNLPWQPIPVHYLPRNQDTLIAMKAKCKKYDEELIKVLNSPTFQKINEENSELFQYLTKHTGQNIDNIGSVELLYNTLEIELLHNLTLPEWTSNVSLTHMKQLAVRYLTALTETDFMKRVKGGVFFKQLISTIKRSTNGPFLYLYAAHDVTLVNILNTLGTDVSKFKPGFGASLIFELLSNDNLNIIYRNNERDDIFFKFQNNINKFEDSVKHSLPVDYELECEN